jgi:hypothetical protein
MSGLNGATLGAAKGSFYWSGGGLASLELGPAFVGATTVGTAYAGGGVDNIPPFDLFGRTASAQGTPIETATELYPIAVPEPTAISLMGLAAASLVVFRCRK